MNPNFDPNQNPFSSILAGLQQPGQGGGQPGQPDLASILSQGASGPGGQPSGPSMMGTPAPQPAPGGAPAGTPAGTPPAMPGTPTLPSSQLEQGKNPSSTKPLVQAISALQAYITSETDRDNILLARNVVKLLTQLVTKSEDSQLGNLQKGY